MKTPLHILCAIAAALLLGGCKSITTRSDTVFFDAQGNKIATHTERTGSRGFFVKSESVKVQGTIEYTNTAPGFTVTEVKNFGADKIGSQGDAESIGAAGTAVGNVVKEAVKGVKGTP